MDPTRSGVMYVAQYAGTVNIWKSTNGGVDWRALIRPGSNVAQAMSLAWFQSVAIDPTNPDHLVASTHAGCNEPYGAACQIESLNAGETWTIARNPDGRDWVENAGSLAFGDDKWLFVNYGGALSLTRDHGVSWQNVSPAPINEGFLGGTLGNVVRDESVGLYFLPTAYNVISSPDGVNWSVEAGLSGRIVGFDAGNGLLFGADQWGATYRYVPVTDRSSWRTIDAPSTLPESQGAPYLRFDPIRWVLYSSNFAGGMWRTVIPH
jgi:hypothetical protein